MASKNLQCLIEEDTASTRSVGSPFPSNSCDLPCGLQVTKASMLFCELDKYMARSMVVEANGVFVIDQGFLEKIQAFLVVALLCSDSAKDLQGVAQPTHAW
jgi:hypothetical protein